MTATIAGDMGETVKGSDHYSALFAVGVVLLVLTFSLNIVSEYFLSRAKKALGK
jgi:phosphate transport system permease protein